MPSQAFTPEPDRRSSSRKPVTHSNVVEFPRRAYLDRKYGVPPIHSEQLVNATRDWGAGWSPIDPDEQLRNAVFEEIREGLVIVAYGVVAALLFVTVLLWARG